MAGEYVRLQEDKFLAMGIPLPSLAEQRTIVTRIEELSAKIQEARVFRQQAEDETHALIDQNESASEIPRSISPRPDPSKIKG